MKLPARCGRCNCQVHPGESLCDACREPRLTADMAARFAVIDSRATIDARRDVRRYWRTGQDPDRPITWPSRGMAA